MKGRNLSPAAGLADPSCLAWGEEGRVHHEGTTPAGGGTLTPVIYRLSFPA